MTARYQTLRLKRDCSVKLDRIPACSRCGGLEVHPEFGMADLVDGIREVVSVTCFCHDCGTVLVARYAIKDDLQPGALVTLVTGPPEHYFEPQRFEPPIPTVSKQFCAIYNEAKKAEDGGLLRICGAGYRKALEFLVKDYLIRHKFVGDRQAAKEIETSPLALCIDKYIDDQNIRRAAHRAAWLGNDETHYVRKWTGKDIKDLKDLIAITVSWIALNVRTQKHVKSMPTGKR